MQGELRLPLTREAGHGLPRALSGLQIQHRHLVLVASTDGLEVPEENSGNTWATEALGARAASLLSFCLCQPAAASCLPKASAGVGPPALLGPNPQACLGQPFPEWGVPFPGLIRTLGNSSFN